MKKDPWFEFPAKRDSRGRIQIPKDILENLPDQVESLTVKVAITTEVKNVKKEASTKEYGNREPARRSQDISTVCAM